MLWLYAHVVGSDMESALFGFINNLLYSLRKILVVLLVFLIAARYVDCQLKYKSTLLYWKNIEKIEHKDGKDLIYIIINY